MAIMISGDKFHEKVSAIQAVVSETVTLKTVLDFRKELYIIWATGHCLFEGNINTDNINMETAKPIEETNTELTRYDKSVQTSTWYNYDKSRL